MILITGGAVYIGSHCVIDFIKSGYDVVILDNLSVGHIEIIERLKDFAKNHNEEQKGNLVDFINADFNDTYALNVLFNTYKIDAVIHFAADALVNESVINPRKYYENNVIGSINLLNSMIDNNVKKIVFSSTCATYGEPEYVPIDEKHPFQGQSPYSATKIGADRLAESFYRSFQLPVTIVRPFNTYGPRQSARAVIPTIIMQLLSGSTEIKLGSLTPTRDFNYVKDTVHGFIAIFQSDRTIGEEINIATQKEISIGQLAKELIDQINPQARILCDEQRLRPEKSEVNRLLGCNEKILRLTDWKPEYSMEKGLAETIKFLSANLERYKVNIYNL